MQEVFIFRTRPTLDGIKFLGSKKVMASLITKTEKQMSFIAPTGIPTKRTHSHLLLNMADFHNSTKATLE